MGSKRTYIIQAIGIAIAAIAVVATLNRWTVGGCALGAALWFTGWYARQHKLL